MARRLVPRIRSRPCGGAFSSPPLRVTSTGPEYQTPQKMRTTTNEWPQRRPLFVVALFTCRHCVWTRVVTWVFLGSFVILRCTLVLSFFCPGQRYAMKTVQRIDVLLSSHHGSSRHQSDDSCALKQAAKWEKPPNNREPLFTCCCRVYNQKS